MSTSDGANDAVTVVLTTAGSDADASVLARALVSERLAACVTRMAARSVYRWEGDVQEEDEVLLVIKTARSLRERIERRILELHPYACPEIVMIDPDSVEARYGEWLLAACRDEPGTELPDPK